MVLEDESEEAANQRAEAQLCEVCWTYLFGISK